MIIRDDYINSINKLIDVPLVKILAGVRRCGKSTVLDMIKSELINKGVKNTNIISRKYNDVIYDDMSFKQMYTDLIKEFINEEKYYLFLDELQEIEGWERVINDILEKYNVDIYVTGSNSKLMSSEISTYLSGRYTLISVYTLSFKEFLKFKKNNNIKEAFDEYLEFGGFPLIGINNFDTTTAYQIVDGIYSAVITNDISKRHKITNRDLFDRIVKFIIENVGKSFSVNSIVNFLKGEKRTISVEAIYNYIKWLEDAFIIYSCNRYDVKEKSVLKTFEKYYLSDISFKYCKFGFNSSMVSSMLENIVFLEMKRREYEVYVGKNNDKEIDFIGVIRNEKIYVQVCKNLPLTSDREIANLMEIKDHYHKYVVTMDNLAKGNENGIEIMHIAEFLLREYW